MDKGKASVELLEKLREDHADQTVNSAEEIGKQHPECLALNVEQSTQVELEVECIGATTLLLSAANRLGTKVDYNFNFANKNNRGGGEHRRRQLADKAEYLSLFDQGLRLNKAFVRIRNPDMRETAINFMTILAEAESGRYQSAAGTLPAD